MASNKFNLELTFAELRALQDLILEAHRSAAYYAEMSDDDVADDVKTNDDGEEIVTNNQWKRTQRTADLAKRARLSELHERITGAPID